MSCPSRTDCARDLLKALTRDEQSSTDFQTAVTALGTTWLVRQGLAPLTWSVCAGTRLPDDLSHDLRNAYYAAAGDAELHRHELASVLRALAVHDIVPVVFKGAALAYTVYPDPACRPMGDLDLWVQANELSEAQKALHDLGYRQVSNPDRPPEWMKQFGGEIQLSGSSNGSGLIELHLSVFLGEWLRLAAAVDEAAVRGRVVRSTQQDTPGVEYTPRDLLSPADALIHLGVHLAINHQLSFFTLRGLVDIVLLARHYSIDWNLIVQRAREWRVATTLWLVLSLAVDLAGLAEATRAVQQLQPSALRRRLIGRLANAESLVMMRDLSASNWRYVFLLLLVDRGRDAMKLVFRALWPERAWLLARYGRVSLATRLGHLFAAMRGKI